MQLIGQYDSPFVRRVGIALTRYGMAFEHLPYSTFGDGSRFHHLNPLRRVPTLVLDDGEVLFGSDAILDHLDEQYGRVRALIAGSGHVAGLHARVFHDLLHAGITGRLIRPFDPREHHCLTLGCLDRPAEVGELAVRYVITRALDDAGGAMVPEDRCGFSAKAT